MKCSTLSKYYDLRYAYHRYYISPVEFQKNMLEKEDFNYMAVDTVTISKEAQIKYKNTCTRTWAPGQTVKAPLS